MIPKRAIFFWEGPEPSWLRRQSWESFKRLNPDWTVDIVDGSECPIPKNGSLSIAHRSDWTRYHELHQRGGVYFDTDIVFIKPVPDAWLNAHLLLPVTAEPGQAIGHVAMLGAVPGDMFFDLVCKQALSLYEQRQYLGYQSLGLRLLVNMKSALAGRDIRWVDPDTVLPVSWDNPDALWNDTRLPLPALSIGVHWYGGDRLSKILESKVDRAWVPDSKCLVAKALKRSGVCDA